MERHIDLPKLIIIDDEFITSDDEEFIQYISFGYFIPILIVTSSEKDVKRYISLGVKDFIYKNLSPDLFLNRVKFYMEYIGQIELYKNTSIKSYNDYKSELFYGKELESSIIDLLSLISEFRIFTDNISVGKIRKYMKVFLEALSYDSNPYQHEIVLWDIKDHITASQLYDVGKLTIPDSILLKREKLNEEDIDKIQQHIPNGIKLIDIILKNENISSYNKKIFLIAEKYIKYHHESYDGSGYPNKLNGINIPLEGRIMCIIDNFNALTSIRPYKRVINFDDVLKFFKENANKRFDKNLIDVFINKKEEFKKLL
jgi:putative two-component system response regulator